MVDILFVGLLDDDRLLSFETVNILMHFTNK